MKSGDWFPSKRMRVQDPSFSFEWLPVEELDMIEESESGVKRIKYCDDTSDEDDLDTDMEDFIIDDGRITGGGGSIHQPILKST
jgi:hypothetical protein